MAYSPMFGGPAAGWAGPEAGWAGPEAGWAGPEGARRKKLVQALLHGGPGAQRLMSRGAQPLFGGLGRGTHSSVDLPNAAQPALTFNPFLAQLQRGTPNLNSPTSEARGQISDLAGHAPAVPQALQPQSGVPAQGGQDNGPTPQTSLADLTKSSGMDLSGPSRFLNMDPSSPSAPAGNVPGSGTFDDPAMSWITKLFASRQAPATQLRRVQ